MRSIVVSAPGGPEVLKQVERPEPEPGSSQIRVRVRASALNRADLLQRRGLYPAPAGAPPDVPGLEYAGVVDAVGEGASLWSVGDRVMGITGGGGYAEYLCVHEREAIAVPDNLELAEAAAIPEAFLTAHDALRRLDVRTGQRVLIHAVASGVGTAALQLARAAGAYTVGTSRSGWKLDRAREIGLDQAIDSSRADWVERVEEVIGRNAIHAVVDLIGGPFLSADLRLLAPRGSVVVVGAVAGVRAEIDLGLLLRKRAHVFGTVLRSRPLEEKIAVARDFAETISPLFADGRLRPIVDRVLPFDDVRTAHEVMEENRNFGKIVLAW